MAHDEVLPENQCSTLRQLGPAVTELGFYMGGGTAVAIQVGHRVSIDFDWFREAAIADPLVLAAELRSGGATLEVQSSARGTLHARCAGVATRFFEYPYPLLAEKVAWPHWHCELASLEDLAAMKLAAVAGRGLKKDFVGVFAILRSGQSLADLLAFYRTKYTMSDVGHVLASLTYFDDADTEEMPRMLWPVAWDEVKADVRAAVIEFLRQAR